MGLMICQAGGRCRQPGRFTGAWWRSEEQAGAGFALAFGESDADLAHLVPFHGCHCPGQALPLYLVADDRLTADLGREAMGLVDVAEPHLSARAGKPGTVTLWAPVVQDEAEPEEAGEEGWIDDATRAFAARRATR